MFQNQIKLLKFALLRGKDVVIEQSPLPQDDYADAIYIDEKLLTIVCEEFYYDYWQKEAANLDLSNARQGQIPPRFILNEN